jgi:hypothetical protein
VVRFVNDDYRKTKNATLVASNLQKAVVCGRYRRDMFSRVRPRLSWPVSLERLVAWGAWFWMRGLMMRSDDVMHRLQDYGSAHNLGCVFARKG